MTDPDLYKARLFAAKGFREAAVARAEAALARHPNDPETRGTLAHLLLAATEGADDAAAVAAARRAVRVMPDAVDVAATLARRVEAAITDAGERREAFADVLADAPDNWYLRLKHGGAQVAAGAVADGAVARLAALGLDAPGVTAWTARPVTPRLLFDAPEAAVQPWYPGPVETAGGVPPVAWEAPSDHPETHRPCLARLREATLLGGEHWLRHGDRLYVDLHFDVPGQHSPLYVDNGAPVLEPRPVTRHDDGPVIALGGTRNYFHWMRDFLPRLAAVLDDAALAGLPLLINDDRASFQEATLRALGVPADRLRPMAYPSAHVGTEMLVPLLPPWTRWQRLAALAPGLAPDGVPADTPRRLFLVREEATHRRLLGADRLRDALAERGFTAVDPGRRGVADQVRLFARAEVVVAPHGAAMANLAFAPAGCRVVEIASEAWPRTYFRDQARALGLDHHTVWAPARPDPAQPPLFRDLVPDDATLAGVLAAVDDADGTRYSTGTPIL